MCDLILFIIFFKTLSLVFSLLLVPTGMPIPVWTPQGPNASCIVLCQDDTTWW